MCDLWAEYSDEIANKLCDGEYEGQEGWNEWDDTYCDEFVDIILMQFNYEVYGKPTPEEFVALINQEMKTASEWEDLCKKFIKDYGKK